MNVDLMTFPISLMSMTRILILSMTKKMKNPFRLKIRFTHYSKPFLIMLRMYQLKSSSMELEHVVLKNRSESFTEGMEYWRFSSKHEVSFELVRDIFW